MRIRITVRGTISRFTPVLWALLLLPACGLFVPANGYEVDNFTDRDKIRSDSLSVMDRKVNEIIVRAVTDTNRESPDRCDRAILRQEIVRWTRPELVSLLELWAAITSEVERAEVSASRSIYAGTNVLESVAISTSGIGRSFKLAGQVIGTDKIGHFFMQGLMYFNHVYGDRRELTDVLANDHGEDSFYGLMLTGVKSYADMSANYAGYKFWSNLYMGDHPYVRCDDRKKWVVERSFTWTEYVTAAWDEAINCSEFIATLKERVEKNLADRGQKCPVDENACRGLAYTDNAAFTVSPQCLALSTRSEKPLAHVTQKQ